MEFLKAVFMKFKKMINHKVTDFNYKLDLKIGDIVGYKSKSYCIINEYDGMILCLPIFLINNNIDLIKMSDFDFKNMIWMSHKKNFQFFGALDENKKLAVIKRYRVYVEKMLNKSNKQRGSLLVKKNQYFYIYGEEFNNWLLFAIHNDNRGEEENIKIADKDYYTNFSNFLEIDKSDETYKVIDIATEDEIEQIKLKKKSYKKRTESKLVNDNAINFATIVHLINHPTMHYFVLKVYSSCVLAISYNNILSGYFIPEMLHFSEIKIDDVKLNIDALSLEILKEMSMKKSFSKPSTIVSKKHR